MHVCVCVCAVCVCMCCVCSECVVSVCAVCVCCVCVMNKVHKQFTQQCKYVNLRFVKNSVRNKNPKSLQVVQAQSLCVCMCVCVCVKRK